MEHKVKWPKWLYVSAAVSGIGLMAEFYMFSYGILKIARCLILLAALFGIAWIDWNEKRIPNKILILLLEIRVVLLILEWIVYPEYGGALLLFAVSGMMLGGGMFLLAGLISRGGLGMGDVKLFAVAGSYMGGGSILAAAFLSVLASAVYSVIMLLLKRIKLKEEIPFAPFILIGIMLTMALGM